jgi:hypothetical protein
MNSWPIRKACARPGGLDSAGDQDPELITIAQHSPEIESLVCRKPARTASTTSREEIG